MTLPRRCASRMCRARRGRWAPRRYSTVRDVYKRQLQYKGESLGRYIRERKLLLAARDLRDTDQRVYDICLKYGFDSQQTFTRVFTRTFNQPPGAYRKENHSRAH